MEPAGAPAARPHVRARRGRGRRTACRSHGAPPRARAAAPGSRAARVGPSPSSTDGGAAPACGAEAARPPRRHRGTRRPPAAARPRRRASAAATTPAAAGSAGGPAGRGRRARRAARDATRGAGRTGADGLALAGTRPRIPALRRATPEGGPRPWCNANADIGERAHGDDRLERLREGGAARGPRHGRRAVPAGAPPGLSASDRLRAGDRRAQGRVTLCVPEHEVPLGTKLS